MSLLRAADKIASIVLPAEGLGTGLRCSACKQEVSADSIVGDKCFCKHVYRPAVVELGPPQKKRR